MHIRHKSSGANATHMVVNVGDGRISSGRYGLRVSPQYLQITIAQHLF